MTTYTAPVEGFLNDREMPISKKLAVALIENFGGEKEFLESYSHAGRNIKGGYGHFVYNKAMVAFYRKNKKEIKAAMTELADDFGFESLGDFAWAASGTDNGWTKEEVVAAMYRGSNKPFEDLDLLHNLLYVWQVQLLGGEISSHYEDYLDQVEMDSQEDDE